MLLFTIPLYTMQCNNMPSKVLCISPEIEFLNVTWTTADFEDIKSYALMQ